MCRIAFFAAMLAILGVVGCSERETNTAPRWEGPVRPGVCVGTKCNPPIRSPLSTGTSVKCSPGLGDPVVVEWSADLGQMPCALGTCPLFLIDAAPSPDGGAWALVNVGIPDGWPSATASPLGTAVIRFDASGKRSFPPQAETAMPLSGTSPEARGLRASSGGLRWVGPGEGSSGLSLRSYDSTGVFTGAHWLVEHATWGDAWLSAGSTVIAYAYVSAVDRSVDPPVPEYRAGVARFDGEGKLLWNQSQVFAPRLAHARVELLGIDATGASYVVAAVSVEGETTAAKLITRVTPGGEVARTWFADEGAAFTVASASGDLFVGQLSGLTRYDRNGTALWTTPLGVVPFAGAVDASDRLILLSDYPAARLDVVSADGSACRQHPLSAEPCVRTRDVSICTDVRLLVINSEVLLMVGTTSVSRLRIPGQP